MVGVTLDFSKAFDTIQHPILLKKLFAYGIRGNIIKLIKSYLANRQQFVTINREARSKNCVVIYSFTVIVLHRAVLENHFAL